MILFSILQAETDSIYSTIVAVNDGAKFGTIQGPYEYWTIFVAIVACMVSVGSFYVAYKTLRSQEKTQANTQAISVSGLQSMLNNILRIVYVNFIRVCAIHKKLEDNMFRECPYTGQIRYMRIPKQYLLADKCSGLAEDEYLNLVKLNHALLKHNEQLESCFNCFADASLPESIKRYEATRLRYESAFLLSLISRDIKSLKDIILKEKNTVDSQLSVFETITAIHRHFHEDAQVDEPQEIELPENIVSFYHDIVGDDAAEFKTMIESDINIFLGKNKRGEIMIPMVPIKK